MNPHDDLPPDDLNRLRTALEQRAGGDALVPSGVLLSSAHRRARSLHRRYVAGGTLAALLFVGALTGALVANHGRATVGVSVAGPTGTTDAPTTTVGNGGPPPMMVPCGESFFSTATWSRLEDHFGPRMDCGRVGNTWLVSFRGQATTAAFLRCDASDVACLDRDAVHDLASFKVVILQGVTADTAGATWSTSSSDGVMNPTVEVIWLPSAAPTRTPAPAVRLTGTASDLSLEYRLVCEPAQGPWTIQWSGQSMTFTSFEAALSVPVPGGPPDTTPPMNLC